MDDTTTFDLGELAPVDRYKLLSGLIVPRPIGWVGTADADGRRNLAPYSFFNMVVGTPPTVLFCPGFHGRMKDSLANAIATGEFTLNMVTEGTVEAMNATSGDYPPDVDEFEIAGLTAVPGTVVSAPMVARRWRAWSAGPHRWSTSATRSPPQSSSARSSGSTS